MANGDVEQGGGDHVAQRLVVRRLGIGDLFALLRELGALRSCWRARAARCGRRGRRGRTRPPHRAARISHRSMRWRSCRIARANWRCRRAGCRRISPARRAAPTMAGSAAGLPALASTAATRPLSASTVAPVTCGAAGGACTAGQPSAQPTAITTAAAAAPENGAMTQGEMAPDATAACASRCSGSALAVSDLAVSTSASSAPACSALACPAEGCASGSTANPAAGSRLRSPRGRWSAGCAWHGRTRGPILRLQACRRPS